MRCEAKEFKLALKIEQRQFTPGLAATTNVIPMSESILFGDRGWGNGRAEGEVVVKAIWEGVTYLLDLARKWQKQIVSDSRLSSPLLSLPFLLLLLPDSLPSPVPCNTYQRTLNWRSHFDAGRDTLFVFSLFSCFFSFASSLLLSSLFPCPYPCCPPTLSSSRYLLLLLFIFLSHVVISLDCCGPWGTCTCWPYGVGIKLI